MRKNYFYMVFVGISFIVKVLIAIMPMFILNPTISNSHLSVSLPP